MPTSYDTAIPGLTTDALVRALYSVPPAAHVVTTNPSPPSELDIFEDLIDADEAGVLVNELEDLIDTAEAGVEELANEEGMSNWRNIDYSGYNSTREVAIVFNEHINRGGGGYEIRTGNRSRAFFSSTSIHDVLNFISGSAFFNSCTVYPQQNSQAWNWLCNAPRDYAEERAGISMRSRASPPTEYSFILNWDTAQRRFILLPPMAQTYGLPNCPMWSVETSQDLSALHQRARTFVEQNKSRTGLTSWNVWPRRNSNYFAELSSCRSIIVPPFGEVENEKHIASFKDLLDICRAIKNSPADLKLEEAITALIRARAFNKFSGDLHTAQFDVQRFLLNMTAVKFKCSAVSSSILIHPDNVVAVRISKTDPNETWFVTLKQAKEHAHVCSHCSVHWKRNLVYTLPVAGTPKVCGDCIEEAGYFNCRNCSELHESARGCPRMGRQPFGYIHGYSTDVRHIYPKFGDTEREKRITGVKLRYGLELEVLRRNPVRMQDACVRVASSVSGDAIIKSDSSIGVDGFEIVTIPATLEYHRTKLWNRFFKTEGDGKSPAQLVQSWGTGVCGLHIHITRAAMTKMQLSKLLVFYHDDKNNAFLSRIAGRAVGPDAHYCKTAKKKLRSQVSLECEDHHDAITISARNRGKTAEVRIFRGNATRHGIMRCLEFVDATVKWCAQNGIGELSWKSFLVWLNQETVRSQYPELWKHLIQLGYLKTKHKSKNADVLLELPEIERIA